MIGFMVDIFHTINRSVICDEGIESYGNRSLTDDVDDHVDITPRYLDMICGCSLCVTMHWMACTEIPLWIFYIVSMVDL